MAIGVRVSEFHTESEMSRRHDCENVRDFSQSGREPMLMACWYVAYSDGRLYREVRLLKAIADYHCHERVETEIKETVRRCRLLLGR